MFSDVTTYEDLSSRFLLAKLQKQYIECCDWVFYKIIFALTFSSEF